MVSQTILKIKYFVIDEAFYKDFILYPSMIQFYKNQIEVFKAYEIFIEKYPDGPNLLFVGKGDENYLKKLEKCIGNSKYSNRVKILKNVTFEQMPTLYKKSKFIIFASMSENCPNILLESLSFGKAILCSKKYPMPEEKNVLYFGICLMTWQRKLNYFIKILTF